MTRGQNKRHIFAACRWCGRGCLSGLFFFSTLFLLAGLGAQVYLKLQREFPVPAVLIQQLQDELEASGLRAAYRKIVFLPPNRVLVENVRLYSFLFDDPVASAGGAYVEFDLFDLLRGSVTPRKIRVEDGVFRIPAPFSISGISENQLERVSFLAKSTAGTWEIPQIRFRVHNLDASGSAHIPAAWMESLPTGAAPTTEWLPLLLKAIIGLQSTHEWLSRFEAPRLQFSVGPVSSGHPFASFELSATLASVPGIGDSRNTLLRGEALFDGFQPERLNLSVESALLRSDHAGTIRSPRLEASWNLREGYRLPDRLRVAAGHTEFFDRHIDDLRAEGRFLDDGTAALNFSLTVEDEVVHGHGHLDPITLSGSVHLEGKFQPERILTHPMLVEAYGGIPLRFFSLPSWNVDLILEEGGTPSVLSGDIHAEDVLVHDALLNEARGRFHLEESILRIDDLRLGYSDFSAEGSYEENLATRDYRFLLHGDLRPMHIASWFQPWWSDLWTAFSFEGSPPEAEIDIQGTWGRPELASVRGAAAAEDFTIRGVDFPFLETEFFIRPHYVDFFNLRAVRDEGEAEGAFQRLLDPTDRSLVSLDFEVNSTLDAVETAPVFGEAGRRIFAPYTFSTAPELQISGRIGGQEGTRVRFAAQTDSPMRYHGVRLDRLGVSAVIEKDTISFDRLEFGFAGGTGYATARAYTDAGVPRLDFDGRLEGADLVGAIEILREYQEQGSEQPPFLTAESIDGLIDAKLSASGIRGDLSSFRGQGMANIREADFGRYHLFGLLSRVLSITPLRFTTLRFSQLESRFHLQENNLKFSRIHLSGENAEIEAAGDYDVLSQNLDFRAKVFLMRENPFPLLPILLAPVLEPLGQFLDLRLTGTVADPQWRFQVNPRSIFTDPPTTPATRSSEIEGTKTD